MALVPRLRAALAITGAALHPIELPGPVRRRRLGGVVGIQIDALFEHLDPFDQQGDDGVALGHGLRKLRQPSIGWVHRQHARRLDLHRGSIAIKSATCNQYFKPADKPGQHSLSGEAWYPVNTYLLADAIGGSCAIDCARPAPGALQNFDLRHSN